MQDLLLPLLQFRYMRRIRAFLVSAPLFQVGLLCAQPWSGILAPSRAVDWSNAGSPAVASSSAWTQCGSTVPAGSSAATINAALAACTANHYVQLAAGAYNLTTGITFGQNSNIKLVGAGADQTLLAFTKNMIVFFMLDFDIIQGITILSI